MINTLFSTMGGWFKSIRSVYISDEWKETNAYEEKRINISSSEDLQTKDDGGRNDQAI